MIATRRMPSTMEDRSLRSSRRKARMRSRAGMMRSFEIIVASATEATMTMPVAAEKPPT